MLLTPVEIIALILIIFATLKIVVLLISPKSWINFVKGLWSNVVIIQLVSFVLAGIVLYYLLQQMTIVQILSVYAFFALMLVFGIASEAEFLFKKYDVQIKQKKLWKRYWFYTLLWVILLAWGTYALFA